MELADDFRDAGGETFVRVPCPNADPRWIAALARLVEDSPSEALAVDANAPHAARA